MEKRRLECEFRDAVQTEKEEHAVEVVLQNRVSWNTFDKMRKSDGLAAAPKRKCHTEQLPIKTRKHGCQQDNISIDTVSLLQEARSRSPTEQVNWSQLAGRYSAPRHVLPKFTM